MTKNCQSNPESPGMTKLADSLFPRRLDVPCLSELSSGAPTVPGPSCLVPHLQPTVLHECLKHTHTQTHVHTNMHTQTHVHTHTHRDTCTQTQTCTHVHTHAQTQTRVHRHTHMYTDTNIHRHAHTDTHKHTQIHGTLL